MTSSTRTLDLPCRVDVGTTHPGPAVRAIGLSSAELLGATSQGALRLHRLPTGPERRARRVVRFLDGPVGIGAGDLVFVPRRPARPPRHVTEEVARSGGVGIVVHPHVADRWAAPAESANLSLFSLGPCFSADEVHRELAAAMAGATRGDGGPDDREQAADLRTFASLLAEEIGCSVVVADARMRPLAHGIGSDADCGIRDWILFGTPPAAERDAWIREAGLRLPALAAQAPAGARTGWTPTPVSVGDDILGALWTAAGTADRVAAMLSSAARSVAALLVHATHVRDPSRRLRADLLNSVLRGTGRPDRLAAVLGVATEVGLRLAVLEPTAGEGCVDLRHLAGRIALRFSASEAAVTTAGERLWVLTSADHSADDVAERLACGPPGTRRSDVRIAVSDPIDDPVDLPAAADELQALLDLRVDGPITSTSDWHGQLVIAEIAQLTGGRSRLRRGAVRRLQEIDERTRSEYAHTLRTYFDAGSDLTKTAKLLHLHRNSLRYRLGRIRTLSGLDLDDPLQRLVAELELRVNDLEATTLCGPSMDRGSAAVHDL